MKDFIYDEIPSLDLIESITISEYPEQCFQEIVHKI